jgi:hypothetical protein
MDNPLTNAYWSAVPYRLGPHAVKYSAQSTNLFPPVKRRTRNFLREAMAEYLKVADAYFDFMVQVQTDADKMPIEDSTIEWDEKVSPFIKVATIRIPRQKFDSAAQREFAENLSYTPWHSLPDHQPLGGMNRARRMVYQAGSELRHKMNRAPQEEPVSLKAFQE